MFKSKLSKQKLRAFIIIILIVPVGFTTKYYKGPAAGWINNSLGGVFYEIFWCLFLFIFFHRPKPISLTLTVFIVTCILEFLQLWHFGFLEFIRSNFVGRTIVDTSFSWSDFIYYIIGSLIGYFMLEWLKTSTGKYIKDRT